MAEMKSQHKIYVFIGILLSLGLIFTAYKADRLLRIGAGYKAKIACSEIFVAGRDKDRVLAEEFAGMPAALDNVKVRVDMRKQKVLAAGPMGLGGIGALYRPGYGCTLVSGGRVTPLPEIDSPTITSDQPWPEAPPVSGQALMQVDYAALDAILDQAFDNNTANHRGLIVVVDGKIVDERYADGFDRSTPLLSWSMAKSVMATLVGAAIEQGFVDVSDPVPVPEWGEDLDKSKITWDDLLRMQSGLDFEEEYGVPRSDVNLMLFEKPDAGLVAARSPLEHNPGDVWYYSSGTSNLVARSLRQVLARNEIDFHEFAQRTVFGPIGASSVAMEPDASGTVVGSSFVYATARDWARLGQLYLQDGLWNGERILPEAWAEYVGSVTPASDGQYGAHFWLNVDGADDRERFVPGVPEDMYYFAGHEGQYVFIIPDKRMIVVRAGQTRGRAPLPEVAPLVREIYQAVGMPSGEQTQ